MGSVLTLLFSLLTRGGLLPVRDLERVATRVAQGDLRQEVEVKTRDEVGRLAEAFRSLVGELRAYSGGATGVSQAIGAATVQINASVQEQTSTVTSQAAAVAQATSSLEELKANAVRNDGRARDVLTTAKSTIQGMKQVQDQVQEIATSIVALSEKTQQISEILDSVSDIADQSNLLALNASIEASKAGEFGRGFEVVAAEVRNLAQQSQKATLSIRTMLRDIQRAMNAAVMGTEEGTKRVERQSTDLHAATQAVEQIVYATREQTQAIEQIADAVSSVSGSISESQASSAQIAEATRGLVLQAEALKSALARFTA
jgi:methyl-accepting chemotaxis protein